MSKGGKEPDGKSQMKTSGYTPISIARRLAGEVKQEREHQFERHDNQGNNVSLSDRFQRTIKSVYLHLHSKNMGSTITLYVKYTYPIYNLTRREENPKRKEEENPQRREMKRSKKKSKSFLLPVSGKRRPAETQMCKEDEIQIQKFPHQIHIS